MVQLTFFRTKCTKKILVLSLIQNLVLGKLYVWTLTLFKSMAVNSLQKVILKTWHLLLLRIKVYICNELDFFLMFGVEVFFLVNYICGFLSSLKILIKMRCHGRESFRNQIMFSVNGRGIFFRQFHNVLSFLRVQLAHFQHCR